MGPAHIVAVILWQVEKKPNWDSVTQVRCERITEREKEKKNPLHQNMQSSQGQNRDTPLRIHYTMASEILKMPKCCELFISALWTNYLQNSGRNEWSRAPQTLKELAKRGVRPWAVRSWGAKLVLENHFLREIAGEQPVSKPAYELGLFSQPASKGL